MPYAFTEQGIAMLSSVLKSQTAVEVNIRIMRAFVSMRRFTRCSNDWKPIFLPCRVYSTTGRCLTLTVLYLT